MVGLDLQKKLEDQAATTGSLEAEGLACRRGHAQPPGKAVIA